MLSLSHSVRSPTILVAQESPVTKTDINPAEVAKLRREGATWAQVRDSTGTKLISTRFAALLEEAGYDRAGVKPVQADQQGAHRQVEREAQARQRSAAAEAFPALNPVEAVRRLASTSCVRAPGVFERAPRSVISSQDSRPGRVGRRLSGRRRPGR
jgi:hypothetical protein